MYQDVFKSTIELGRNKQLCRLCDRGELFTKIVRRLRIPLQNKPTIFISDYSDLGTALKQQKRQANAYLDAHGRIGVVVN